MKVGVLASEIGDPLSVNPTSEFCDSGLTGGCQLEGFSVGIARPKREPPSGITVVTFCSLWPSFCRRVAAHSSGTQVDEVSKGCGFRSPSRGPPP